MKPEDVKPKFLWRSFGVQGYEPVEAIPAHEVGAIIKAFDKDTTKYYEVTRMHPVGHPKRIEGLKKLGAWLAKAEELEAMK